MEGIRTPRGEENLRWSDTLRKFVRRTGTLPPLQTYELHPAYDDLIDLLVDRRASWEGAYEGEALTICRTFIHVDDHYHCLGGCRADLLQDRVEYIENARKHPQNRPSKWRENARLRALVAELLDKEEPLDPHVWRVWRALGWANYVPHISHLTRKVAWQ